MIRNHLKFVYLSDQGVSELSHEEELRVGSDDDDSPTHVGGSVLCRLIGVVLLDSSLTSEHVNHDEILDIFMKDQTDETEDATKQAELKQYI